MRDAEVERAPDDRALRVERTVVAEVVPQAQRERRQLEAAPPDAVVAHAVVPFRNGDEGHAVTLWRWKATFSPAAASGASTPSTAHSGASTDVVSGYTGGTAPNPSYEAVCTGSTGHAEAVRVDFDPDVIPREVILDVFFTLHDPTQLNRRGRMSARSTARRCSSPTTNSVRPSRRPVSGPSDWWPGDVVTTIEPLGDFFTRRGVPPGLLREEPGAGLLPRGRAPEGEQDPAVLRRLRPRLIDVPDGRPTRRRLIESSSTTPPCRLPRTGASSWTSRRARRR